MGPEAHFVAHSGFKWLPVMAKNRSKVATVLKLAAENLTETNPFAFFMYPGLVL